MARHPHVRVCASVELEHASRPNRTRIRSAMVAPARPYTGTGRDYQRQNQYASHGKDTSGCNTSRARSTCLQLGTFLFTYVT
jgi:hypothetical protein